MATTFQPSTLQPSTFQPSMLDLAEDGAELADLARVTRHPLHSGAWVDHLPGWVTGSDGVLSALLHDVPWRAERRRMYDADVQVPRLLAWYGRGARLPHALLTEAHRALNAHYAREL